MQRHKSVWQGLLLAAPALLLVLAFMVFPVFYTLYFSLTEGPGFQVTGFVGFNNYRRLLSDSMFLNSTIYPPKGALITSIQWLLFAVPMVVLIGLLVSLATDRSPLQSFVRAAFFLPMVLSGTAIGIIRLFVFAPNKDIGLLNAITNGTQAWLGDPNTVNLALISAWAWGQTGLAVVIISAALKSVPEDIINAAQIDGADNWHLFWRITLPSIRIPMAFLVTTLIVQVLKVFDVVFVMTGGGPAGLSRTLALLFYEQTFRYLNTHYGSAIVVVMSLIIIIIFGMTRKIGDNSDVQ